MRSRPCGASWIAAAMAHVLFVYIPAWFWRGSQVEVGTNGLRLISGPASRRGARAEIGVRFRACADAKTLPGVTDPFPNIFDPANLLANATSVQEVRRWRESEVTHGRVAMLAALGFIVGEQVEDFSSPFFPQVTGAPCCAIAAELRRPCTPAAKHMLGC